MGFLNKCIMVGNVTRAPEVKITGSGVAVCNFGLATNRRYKSNNELKEETCFIDIISFGRTAEIAGEFLAKGAPVLVEGRLSFNQWEQEGVKRSKHEIIADNIQLMGKKNAEGNTTVNNPAPASSDKTLKEEDIDFDVPF